MRPTLLRHAQSVTTRPLNLHEASAQLYPPIPLYRRILRAHRCLPADMRILGDEYVRSEYRRHRATTNPLHVIGFLSEWKVYLEQLPASRHDGGGFRGRKLDAAMFEKMSAEQIAQLYELMHATKDVWKRAPGEAAGGKRPS